MVVAKFFSTQSRTAAAMPVRHGVAAEVVLRVAGIFDPLNHLRCAFHHGPYPRWFLCKVFETGGMGEDLPRRAAGFRLVLGLKEKARQ